MSEKETKKTLKLTFPRIAPYKEVENFLNSKNVLTHAQLPSLQLDQPRHDPQLKLTSVHRIHKNTLEALENRREFYKEQRVVLAEQWEELERLEERLRDNFIVLSNFIKSNEAKRNRAVARKGEDEKLIETREREIKRLIEKIQCLQKTKDELDKEIVDHSMYKTYLDSVVTEALEFKNATDIIDRYESLVETKRQLGERQSDAFYQLEHVKTRIEKLAEDNAFRLLGMNTTLAGMNSRYQTALRNAMHWERIVFNIKTNALKRFKEITEVKQACRNMYLIMCKRKGETPKIPEEECLKQLNYIKKTLQEMASVRLEAEAITKKTFSSMKGETSKSS